MVRLSSAYFLPISLSLPSHFLPNFLPLNTLHSSQPFIPRLIFAFTMSKPDPLLYSTLRPLDSGLGTPSLKAKSSVSASSTLSSTSSSSPQSKFSALGYASEPEFLDFVVQKVQTLPQTESNVTEYQFTDIPLSWGRSLFEEVDKIFRFR
jgi:hypothetical protein